MRFVLLTLGLASACRPPGWGKDQRPDAAEETTVDASGSPADTQLDAALATTCEHTFRLDGYAEASSVVVTGSFSAWAATSGAGAIALSKGLDGAWTVTHTFDAGTYQYKLVVDGNWIVDPSNQYTTDDGMGHTNSVYTCVP
jgi:hypothetical protein